MSSADNVNSWIERVKHAYLSSDPVLTESLLQQALEETDSAPRVLEISGMIAYKSGDVAEAARQIEAAMFQIGLSISGQLTLANAWLQLGKFDSAKTTVAFLVDLIDRVPCSMLPDLSHLCSALSEYELAIAVCREAFDRHPDDDNAVFGAAFYMYRAGYPLELVKNMMFKAVEMNPASQLYNVNLAVVCCSLEDWETAYVYACRLSDQALSSVPCGCMVEQLMDLFNRFNDSTRLEKLNFGS